MPLISGNMGSKIAILQQFGDNYAARIEKEQKKILDLNFKIKDVQIKIEQSRKQIKDNYGERENTEDVAKKIKALENRIDKQLQKFNQAVAQNKNIREQIDSVRREKVVFEEIYEKLSGELTRKKNLLLKTIKKAEDSYLEKQQI